MAKSFSVVLCNERNVPKLNIVSEELQFTRLRSAENIVNTTIKLNSNFSSPYK